MGRVAAVMGRLVIMAGVVEQVGLRLLEAVPQGASEWVTQAPGQLGEMDAK